MSEVNLDELARNAIDAFNTGDTDRLLSMCDPEIEFFSPSEQRTYRGFDGVARYMDDLAAVMEEFHMELQRLLDAGNDRVVVLYRMVAQGAGSGVPVNQEVGAVWQLRNGKLRRGELYLDHAEALEAAGLSE